MIGLAAELSDARLCIDNSIISKNNSNNSYLRFLQTLVLNIPCMIGLAAELSGARLCIDNRINSKNNKN